MSKPEKTTGPVTAKFERRHPFEPNPGEKGMNLEQLIEAGLVKRRNVTTQGAYFQLLGLMKTLKARREARGFEPDRRVGAVGDDPPGHQQT